MHASGDGFVALTGLRPGERDVRAVRSAVPTWPG